MEEKGKVAMVTGATGSLGRSVTKNLLDEGLRVISIYKNDNSQEALLDYLGPLQAMPDLIQCDVTVESVVTETFKKVVQIYGRLDVLVNLVGAYLGGHDVQETSVAEWDAMMSVNLRSAFLCFREALPIMTEQNYGKIVNVAARPALEKRYRPKNSAYAVSKAGILILTETIAEETKKLNININAIVPSTMDTPDNRIKIPQGDFSKWVSPEDVAKVIVHLISDDFKVTSGATIEVYGKA